MTAPAWIWDEVERFERGMGPHYATLYSVVRGCEARRVLEFGTGVSSQVIVAALRESSGVLYSVSPNPSADLPTTVNDAHWRHTVARSEAIYPYIAGWGPFDVVLHDGSHDAETVEADLAAALPHVRRFGVVLVHDTQHSYSGPGVCYGMLRAIRQAPGVRVSGTTLPYAFGLTVLRVEETEQPPIELRRSKAGSLHLTVPSEVA